MLVLFLLHLNTAGENADPVPLLYVATNFPKRIDNGFWYSLAFRVVKSILQDRCVIR